MSQQEQDPINEYEEVKSQNRRRLIGALALVAGALIASAISNSSQEEKAPVMAEAPAKAKKPDVLTPPGSPQPANTQTASAEQPENANGRSRTAAAFPDENGAVKPVPTLAQGNELPPEKPSIDDRQRHEAREKARAEQAEERDLMLAREREQQRIKAEERKKRREEAERKKAEERLAREEEARQQAEKQREQEIADAARRRKAQAIIDQQEAERAAKQRAIAEKARQAQSEAEQNRRAERERLAKRREEQERRAEKEHIEKEHRAKEQAAERSREAERKRAAERDADAKKRAAERERDAEKKRTAERDAERKRQQEREAAKRQPEKRAEAKPEAKKDAPVRAVVQAGAYRDKEQARKVQQQLKGMNYDAHLEEVKTDKGTVYRVKTGTFPNKEAAGKALDKIQSRGIAGRVLEHKK